MTPIYDEHNGGYRGELTIELDYNFTMTVEFYYKFIEGRDNTYGHSFWHPTGLSGNWYYDILPNRPIFALYNSETSWTIMQLQHHESSYLRYQWDGTILTLRSFLSKIPTTTKWRRVG